jgi:hypothetical protein
MNMKFGIKMLILAAVATMGSSCRDRAYEKRLADVESRLAQLEGKNPNVNPVASVTPSVTTPPADVKPEGPLPEMQFDAMQHDFGTVTEGQKVIHVYKVKNTGQAPLLIQNAQPSCGCTAPDWTKTPIPVGESGFVKAEFDTKGKPGMNNKTITVTANTWPKTSTLTFKAQVIAKADGANGPLKK